MKIQVVSIKDLVREERWDIDYHLPPEGIAAFPEELVQKVDAVADVVKTKRDPTKRPDESFLYIDISCVDVETGNIREPQELTGAEAPSRARKVVHAYDVIISTCRPTRGAIAVVPEELHGQICSTGFSVIRARDNINPFYLHYALRLPSTLEQFRKWSTGSSYPAILDEDVLKTRIPVPPPEVQDDIAHALILASKQLEESIRKANEAWRQVTGRIYTQLAKETWQEIGHVGAESDLCWTIAQIRARCAELGPVEEEENGDAQLGLLED